MNSISTNSRAISNSTDISLEVIVQKRSLDTYTFVSAIARPQRVLQSPGTEDMMSIEWEPNKGSYYGYSESQYTTLKSYTNRNNGILVFNVQDVYMSTSANGYAMATAKVRFNNNSNRGSIGINYIHTFTDSSPTLTIGGNVEYKNGQVSGGLTIGLTISNINCVWERSYLYS